MNNLKLSDICLKISDGTHSTVIDDKNGTCFLLSCKNIKDGQINITSSDRRINSNTLNLLRKRTYTSQNDIVLTSVGTIGEVSFIQNENPNFEFQRSVALLKPNLDIVIPQFLYYYLASQVGQNEIKSHVKGAAQPCLFLNDIKNMKITLPSLSIQQHIVNTIGTIDDLIENLEKQRQLLTVLGEQLYVKEISECFYNIEISKLEIKYGTSIPQSERVVGEIPLFASNGIIDYINMTNTASAIVFGCRGTLGNVFYHKGPLYVLNTAFYLNDEDNYGNIFFALRYEKGLIVYSTGAAQPQITIDAIKNVSLKIPLNQRLNKILDTIQYLTFKIENLLKIKSQLLAKYF